MAILKCKMCGGDLNVAEGQTVCECDYCGSKQTVPTLDNEKKLTLFTRANRLRSMCEFDKAYNVYESIVSEFPEEAEAYWGLVLCKYGIEYVDDPASGKKIPTCHRSSFDPVLEDSNYEMVMEYADSLARSVYRAEAKEIERLRSGILEVSAKEQPYDIFICYKETDENGSRTIDSVIAQDVYTALTEKGYRVFFSRITLEDKLGQEYEPYIFAALHSAKIMLVFGTDYDYFNAVWVKNEWSRYLALIAKGEKKTLIPCYKDVDAYDMPQEFKRLQAQDMGKVGAIQDLLRGIEKILPRQKPEQVKEIVRETVVVQQVPTAQGSTVASLLKRAFMMLEESNWAKADELLEQVLNIDPECGEAYLGKLLAEKKIKNREKLKDIGISANILKLQKNYKKAFEYGDEKLKAELSDICNSVEARRIENEYQAACKKAEEGTLLSLREAETLFERLRTYKDSEQRAIDCKSSIVKLSSSKRSFFQRANLLVRNRIAAHDWCTYGVKADGTVAAEGKNKDDRCNVSNWTEIVAISAGLYHSVGLKSDGTVVTAGSGMSGMSNVKGWNDIVCVSAGCFHTAGLRKDGTVVAVGDNKYGQCNTSEWKDIIQVVTGGSHHTVGLKTDGTVVAVGDNTHGQCNVSEWKDITAVAANAFYTIGLKKDGTVVRTAGSFNKTTNAEIQVPQLKDIIAIALTLSSSSYAVGLCADGTVVKIELGYSGKCQEMVGWRDIVAIAAGEGHIVGVKADGTVITDGKVYEPGCKVTDWKLFDSIDALEEQRKLAEQKAEEAKKKVSAVTHALKNSETKAGPTLKERLAAANAKTEHLEQILSVFNATQAQIRSLQSELTETVSQEKQLTEQRSRLGVFAGKEKKRIDVELSILSAKKINLPARIDQKQNAIDHYAALADVERDLCEAKRNAADLETQIANADIEYSFEEALRIYLSEANITRAVNASLYPLMQPDSIAFGRYIQKENGRPEPIEWQVLARENGRVLIISKYALDCVPYNTLYKNVTWETCSLRKWLNETFLNAAFSSVEQNSILSTKVTPDKNPPYSVSPGNYTTDKVFLLSNKEVKKYFFIDIYRKCQGTPHCYAKGAFKHLNACWWWLRSPGTSSARAADVGCEGTVVEGGDDVNRQIAVRPAMWINLGTEN